MRNERQSALLATAFPAAAAVRTYARKAGSRRWPRAHLFRKQIALRNVPGIKEICPQLTRGEKPGGGLRLAVAMKMDAAGRGAAPRNCLAGLEGNQSSRQVPLGRRLGQRHFRKTRVRVGVTSTCTPAMLRRNARKDSVSSAGNTPLTGRVRNASESISIGVAA